MALTAATITRDLHKLGHDKIELVRGEGYFYFIYDDRAANVHESESHMVYRIDAFSRERWVSYGVDFSTRMRQAKL